MSKAERLGFSPERLKRIDAFLEEKYVGPGRLPCAQFVLARGGEVVHQTLLGQQDPERGVPIAEDTVFRIYSMTKPVTSVALMQLVEEGKIALDDPVERHIPSWKGLGVFSAGTGPYLSTPAQRPMQVVDLLRHTSGLTYGFQYRSNIDAAYRAQKSNAGPVENWYGEADLNQFIADLGQLPLEFSPGESWNYSVSTDVLGAVVERVSGMPLDRFFAEKIFTPLKMNDTAFMVPPGKADRLTDCYMFAGPAGRVMYDRGETSMYLQSPRLLSGGGGLVSTALDYHRFCLMLGNGGELDGVRILGRKTVDLMTMNHLPNRSDLSTMSQSLFSETQNGGVGFGLGFAVTQDVARAMIPGSPGEFYWGGMFTTAFFVDPVEKLHMVFMTQLSPSMLYPIRRELKTLIYSALT